MKRKTFNPFNQDEFKNNIFSKESQNMADKTVQDSFKKIIQNVSDQKKGMGNIMEHSHHNYENNTNDLMDNNTMNHNTIQSRFNNQTNNNNRLSNKFQYTNPDTEKFENFNNLNASTINKGRQVDMNCFNEMSNLRNRNSLGSQLNNKQTPCNAMLQGKTSLSTIGGFGVPFNANRGKSPTPLSKMTPGGLNKGIGGMSVNNKHSMMKKTPKHYNAEEERYQNFGNYGTSNEENLEASIEL